MVQKLQLARRQNVVDAPPADSALPWTASPSADRAAISSCPHRTAAKDGRIVCSKVIEGDNEVTPNTCRDCPFKAVNCQHLRFSLHQRSPSPLIVRYNGRTEIWDDGPCELSFERAACAARVIPIHEPRSCVGCALHKPIQAPASLVGGSRKAPSLGKVVTFPNAEPVAAAG